MTEEEAKTKWCPMVRDVRMTNENLEIGSGYCKASACMMWRTTQYFKPIVWPAHPAIKPEKREPDEMVGYCGLGRQP